MTRILLPAALLLLTLPLRAQLLPDGRAPRQQTSVAGVQGRLRVKLTPTAFADALRDGRLAPALFGARGTAIDVTAVERWMPPRLLARAAPLYKRRGGAEDPLVSLGRIVEVRYRAGVDPHVAAGELERLRDVVEYAEPVYPRQLCYTPDDPHIPNQWYLETIGAFEAWDVQRADSTIIIAIVDSGIDPDHPDLAGALWKNPGESGDNRELNNVDDDNNGFVDDVWGWDFYGEGPDQQDNEPRDFFGHGTHGSGCAAGIGNNGTGIAGVAWGARLMPVKITDDPGYNIQGDMQGVFYAATMGARVINLSFGGPGRSRAEQEVIDVVRRLYDPIIVAAAANNDNGVDYPSYPASYDGVISVAATDQQNGAAPFTNYWYSVDLSAPGDDIWSTYLTSHTQAYGYDDGTSFSSPIVAGAAALVRLKNPGWSAERVTEVLRATSYDNRSLLSDALRNKMGAGRLDVGSALLVGDGIASARVLRFTVDETVDDGALMPGEVVRIRAEVTNMLAAADDVTVTLTPDGHGVPIDNNVAMMGAMAAGETRTTGSTVFGFTIPADAAPDSELRFLLNVVTTPGRSNVEAIVVPVAKSWGTTDLNDISLTFTSFGEVGFRGIGPRARRGDGFSYIPNGDSLLGLPAHNILFHGGLMIGTDPDHISAAVRRGLQGEGVDTGFAPRAYYRITTSGDSTLQTGTARFDDLHRLNDGNVGVEVSMTTEERRDGPTRSLVLVRYRITNLAGRTLQNIHCGLFLDWDVGYSSSRDTLGYDPARKLAWQRGAEPPFDIVVGTALLSDQAFRYSAVDIDVDPIIFGFADTTRWRLLSAEGATHTDVGDKGMVVGGGGFDLAPGASTDVIFAIGAARSLADLERGVDELRNTVSAPRSPASDLQLLVAPNPTRDRAELRFVLPASGRVTMTIHRPDGAQIATPIENEMMSEGEGSVQLDADALPAGLYIVRLRCGESVVERSVVVQ